MAAAAADGGHLLHRLHGPGQRRAPAFRLAAHRAAAGGTAPVDDIVGIDLGRDAAAPRRVMVAAGAVMNFDRRSFIAGLAGCTLSTALGRSARAQQLETTSVKLGVANKSHLYYLPLTLAERRGYFKDYGLNVAIADFEGGGQSLDALLEGAVDVVTGAYEHTLRMQAKGQDVRALIELGRFPGIVLGVRKKKPYRTAADLRGLKIGVTAPGSSTHFFVLYLMAKAGLKPSDASFVGVGGGPAAVAAVANGEVDAIATLDPVITRLQQDGVIKIAVDARFPRVNYEI